MGPDQQGGIGYRHVRGELGGNRTHDPRIKSALLYQAELQLNFYQFPKSRRRRMARARLRLRWLFWAFFSRFRLSTENICDFKYGMNAKLPFNGRRQQCRHIRLQRTSCEPGFQRSVRSGMTERPWEAGQGGLPRDMAALYAQAQSRATRYWDFSASRRQVRGQFGQREQAEATPSFVEPVPPPEPEQQTEPAPRQQAQTTRRWYALNSVLFPSQVPVEAGPVVAVEEGGYPPTVVVVSSAGGAGKTCLVATLGRALAGLGEQVLLADRSPAVCCPSILRRETSNRVWCGRSLRRCSRGSRMHRYGC